MAVEKATPPLYAKGRYVLQSPWSADPAVIYTCMAIRTFEDCYERDIDVFTEFYQPHGLSESDFQQDRTLRANIITLISEEDGIIYVPDTYIDSYPNMANVTYSHVVVSLSLGPLPDFLSLDFMMQQMSNKASDVLGVAPDVKVNKAPHAGMITPEQHEVMEANRVAAIQNLETDYAKAKRLQETVNAQAAMIETLENIIRDNGLLE